jgi:hypothetical protein
MTGYDDNRKIVMILGKQRQGGRMRGDADRWV